MGAMRVKLLLTVVLGMSLSGLGLPARAQSAPACQAPIKYRIGAIDPRFGITRADFQRDVEEAGKLWEGAAGRKLFSYDDKGALEINLVYDSRQETTQRLIAVRDGVVEKLEQIDAIQNKIAPLQAKIRVLDGSYSAQAAAYRQALDDHNRMAAQFNLTGGAPEGAYQQLNSESLALRKRGDALDAQRQELNRLTADMNELVRTHNALLERARAEANSVSTSPDAAFEEGRYVRLGNDQRIEIYQYHSEAGLKVVLSHELGHALGIRHNANQSSIMAALIQTERLALTADDMNGLGAACRLHQPAGQVAGNGDLTSILDEAR
jgi:hypothetical protein